MVKTVASSQVLNSQASYLTALADADRIGQAIDLSMNGKKVVGLDQYITRFSNLSMQRQIRQELGINPTLKALHERLDTALENLSGRVVSVASKMSLDAANQASKAASLARQQNTSKPWTWRQRITYGTIGGLAAGFVIYYPVMTWNLFINTPRAAKTAYHTSDEFLKTAPGTVAAGATVIGGFATGLGALIGKTRQGASAAGIDVPPPPTTLEAKMGTGFSLIANHLLCTTVASRVSPIFSLVTNRAGFLPSANTFCTMTTALEAIRPNTTEPALQWIGEQASSAGQKLAAWLEEHPKAAETAVVAAAGVALERVAEFAIPPFHNAVMGLAPAAAPAVIPAAAPAVIPVPLAMRQLQQAARYALQGIIQQHGSVAQGNPAYRVIQAVQQAAQNPGSNQLRQAVANVLQAAQQGARNNAGYAGQIFRAVQVQGTQILQAGGGGVVPALGGAAPVLTRAQRFKTLVITWAATVAGAVGTVFVGLARLSHLRRPW